MRPNRNYLWVFSLSVVIPILFIWGNNLENRAKASAFSVAIIKDNNKTYGVNRTDERDKPAIFNSDDWRNPEKTAADYPGLKTVYKQSAQETVTDIDGNVYQTVLIGEKLWMAENLKTTKYNDGSPLLTRLSDSDWRTTTSGAYSLYPHDDVEGINSESAMLAAYGAIYNWYSLEKGNLCPVGWHVASDEEWTEMTGYIASVNSVNIGNQLKSCRQDGSPLGRNCAVSRHPRWDSHKLHHGTDKFGFAALPGGVRSNNGAFSVMGSYGNWWSATGGTAAYAWSWRIGFNSGDIYRFLNHKACGFSVRCVRDPE